MQYFAALAAILLGTLFIGAVISHTEQDEYTPSMQGGVLHFAGDTFTPQHRIINDCGLYGLFDANGRSIWKKGGKVFIGPPPIECKAKHGRS